MCNFVFLVRDKCNFVKIKLWKDHIRLLVLKKGSLVVPSYFHYSVELELPKQIHVEYDKLGPAIKTCKYYNCHKRDKLCSYNCLIFYHLISGVFPTYLKIIILYKGIKLNIIWTNHLLINYHWFLLVKKEKTNSISKFYGVDLTVITRC